MRNKAAHAKDCVLLAFEPDKKHLEYLVDNIYGIRGVDEKKPIRNMCLITTNKLEKTEGNIINIRLPDDYDFGKVEESFNLEDPINCKKDRLIENIYSYIKILRERLLIDSDYINAKFRGHKAWFNKQNIEKFSDESNEAALLLSFAYKLYAEEYEGDSQQTKENHDEKKEGLQRLLTLDSIITAVRESYLVKGESINNTFDKAVIMCRAIDSYFKKTTNSNGETSYQNSKKIKKIGEGKTDIGIKVWGDNDYIYIRPDDIKEMLKLQQCSESLSMKVKVILSEKEIIKKYIKNDGKPEYSVHLPKVPECDKKVASLRYIAFNRVKCRQYGLFDNIDEIISNRCQIDVKTEENEEDNMK